MEDILSKINSPEDIKNLDMEQLRELCSQIRSYMVECCAVNPGHLGSSLGAVELIVALHYVYDTPGDKIVYDVSHQAYAHKIITGRREAFRKNRQADGISGFTRRDESPYDAFGAGHSSTSISAALGLAKASQMLGDGHRAVALIGDGSLSGGLAFEGLNNAGDSNTDILIVINDNNMSIDNNIGAIHSHLLQLTTDPRYNVLKRKLWDLLGEGKFRQFLKQVVVTTKSHLVSHSGGDLFEAMGFRYFGPIDGNDISAVVQTLKRLRDLPGPRILHTITKKGKGYGPAEEDQTTWHAPGLFDAQSGKRIKKEAPPAARYQDVFGEVLLELARQDKRIVGITPAMASGCGMNILAREMPERFFDVGIAEEHAVTFSAGLAAGGMKPFCNIYSSFSQRAYDQIIHDVALQNLPVVLCFDRAGLVGEDGATHHGSFDMAALRCIPGCTIAAPRNECELKNLMFSASQSEGGPYIIRYPRGCGEGVSWRDMTFEKIEEGKGEILHEGSDILILALGHCANRALEAAEALHDEGIEACVWDVRFLKPLDSGIVEKIRSGKYSSVVTVEDGSITGGLYSAISEIASSADYNIKVYPLGIPDIFIHQGKQSDQREQCGLSADKIFQKVLQIYKK